MSFFTCKHCFHKFKRESAYKKHECKEMRRHKMLRSKEGMVAYDDYSTWLQLKSHRNYGREHFVDSKYFISFYKFGIFAAKLAIPGKKKFIEYMVELDIYPKDWSTLLVYDAYIEDYERLLTPKEQAAVTVETVFELTRTFDCETNEIFEHLAPAQLIQIVQAKKLSPWILLFSTLFLEFVKFEFTREQRLIMGKFIDYEKWGEIFKKYPKEAEDMKTYVKALKL